MMCAHLRDKLQELQHAIGSFEVLGSDSKCEQKKRTGQDSIR